MRSDRAFLARDARMEMQYQRHVFLISRCTDRVPELPDLGLSSSIFPHQLTAIL